MRAHAIVGRPARLILYRPGRVCYPFSGQDRASYPTLRRCRLRFVPTPVASQLTGLSTDKLREWTSRRALIPADLRPKSKGSPAKFSWQTILVLRVAVLLRDHFSIELQAHKTAFADLRKLLRAQSFIALWGKRLALGPGGAWSFVGDGLTISEADALLIALDPHLTILRDGFALPGANDEGQLDLFSLPSVRGAPPAKPSVRPTAIRRAS